MLLLSKSRLSYKIVGSLILIFLLTFMTLGVVVSMVFENTILVSEKQKAHLLLRTIERPLQIALYLKFFDQIGEKVSSVTSVPDVTELDVYDQNKKVLYRYKSNQNMTFRHEAISITYEIKEPTNGQLMGSVRLRYSDLAYDETRQSIQKIVYGVGGASIFVIFFIAVWWVRYLLSPLTKIAKKVRYYKPGDQMVFEEDGSVEIEQIVMAFNTMQKTTQTYLEQIEAMNASLEITVQEKTHELENQYYLDRLTGLPNRYSLQERLTQGDEVALAVVNVDDFKEVNDFFGISIGDEMLMQIGTWLKELSGGCYRLGGDEFALIFHEMSHKELEHRLSMLIKLLDEKTFMVKEESLNIRVTIGVAMGSDKVLTQADIALHHAKENKKQIAFYNEDEGVEEHYRTNLTMASNVRRALFERRITCFYQPIVDIVTGQIVKYETLVRMIDEAGNIVPPMEFLPIAKQTKLYPQITLEVLYQACTLFASRSEEFSINLSDSDIRNPHTVSEIIKTISETGTASRIVFEILESEGIENYDEVTRFIFQVKALGAKIAIDDFGTGYSNFENILKLGVDYIKIDGSLIREIGANPRHRIIVETIIDFAKKIDAKTIAEFVSDEVIYNTIEEMGVDYSQGYFTGKPTVLS